MDDRSVTNCSICEGEFYAAKLDENGRCDSCRMRFPNAKSKEELQKQREGKNEKYNEGNIENIVKRTVMDMLTELGILQECECGQKYFKRSPAQKTCGNCPEQKA